MRDVVICEPLRTPVGGFGGVFRDLDAQYLAATLIAAVVQRTGVDPSAVEDVILGQASPNGEAPAIGRVAALDAGLSVDVPGRQVDRRCGSGLQAVIDAVCAVGSGGAELILAGGVESMSGTEFAATGIRWGVRTSSVALDDRLARARLPQVADGTRCPAA